ncbi:tyrosine-protein kinase Yes-like [Haliotis asinina]|uniref:tyrosine-protein kinase Yes-like n=1 Tax=Haliotis asinina TaxID=109174 RepID=UPI003531B34D
MGNKWSKKPSRGTTPSNTKKAVTGGAKVPASHKTTKAVVAKKPVLPPDRPLPALPQRLKYLAQFSFTGTSEDDLSFKKGDYFYVDESSLDNDWWLATNVETGKRGYIPSNYVCKDDQSTETKDWWVDFDRNESTNLLFSPGIEPGMFLVRDASDKTSFVLSVRDQGAEPSVRHYRIRRKDNGGCFINPKRVFSNMVELINHHKKHADGVCVVLKGACPKSAPAVAFRDLEVPRSAVTTSELLGAGHFGQVWKGKLWNGIDVAVKSLKPESMSPEAFMEEAEIMHKLRHKKLVQLRAVCSSKEPILIITELMVNGSLLDYIRKDQGKKIRFLNIVSMASQIADGMAYLESQNFIHRDLRAANVLVGEFYDVKLSDFGLARILEDEVYRAHDYSKFPVKWTAPEAISMRMFSVKSDVWSFGIVLYELITFGKVPYPGWKGHEVLDMIEKSNYRMPRPTGPFTYPDSFYEVMLKCWNKCPDDRPTFAYLHELFADYFVSTESGYKDTDAM